MKIMDDPTLSSYQFEGPRQTYEQIHSLKANRFLLYSRILEVKKNGDILSDFYEPR